MRKNLFLSFIVVLFCSISIFAQDRKVSGKITAADDGSGLPGVTVQLKGTSKGVLTDGNGQYSIVVPNNGGTLVYSFIGLMTQEVSIGNKSTIDVALANDEKQLSEVVITAQGIARERKALGYAATSLKASELEAKPETDVARALQGRAPGVQIAATSGLAGSGSKITIRGISSVTGDTQPLWVVDGVPISNATNETNADFRDGNITPSRSLDIDPNNIESMSVLRGLSATTLYGSQGRNGVILVTTKGASGRATKNKFTASVSQSVFGVEAVVPEFQNKWANGFDGDYGEFFSNWGAPFSSFGTTTPFRHPYFESRALFPDRAEFQQATNYVPQAYANNVKDFFRRGVSRTTAANVGYRTDGANINLSVANLNEDGYILNNNLTRTNISLGGNANLTKRLSMTSTFNFVKTDFKTPPVAAGTGSNSDGGASVFANLFYTPRSIDLMGLPYQNPVTGGSVYYRNNNSITNPRWILENAQQAQNTQRFFTNMSMKYDLASWANLMYRVGYDTYTEDSRYWINKGSVGYPAAAAVLATGLNRTTTGINAIIDQSVILNLNKRISDDLDIAGNVGYNNRYDSYKQDGMESSNQVVYGLISHRNFIDNNDRDFRGQNLSYKSERLIRGIFADATFSYKNAIYLNLQGRNDYASSLEADRRSQFYPGASLSIVPTSLFSNFKSSVLDFLKIRGGYGSSANFPGSYNTRPYLSLNSNASVDPTGNVVTLALPTFLPNKGLNPEVLTEKEIGVEAKLFDNRIGIDLSFYSRLANDQILERDLDPSTGYSSTLINAGSISNKGIELGLILTPIRTRNFNWESRINFTKNKSMVESLPEGSKEIVVSGYTNLGNFAIEGKPFGVIQGTFVNKNENGDLIVNDNGDWDISQEIGIIGDPNPDYLLSNINEFRYKNITLSGQVDFVKGGDVFSYTAGTLIGRGVAKDLESFDPTLPLILPGVDKDGNPNTKPQTTSGVFFGNTILAGAASSTAIYDATRLRLREVSLSYTLPSKLFTKGFVKGIAISAVGQNLWWRAFNAPKYTKVDFDRTSFGTGNGSGFDFLDGPSARRYGMNVKFNF